MGASGSKSDSLQATIDSLHIETKKYLQKQSSLATHQQGLLILKSQGRECKYGKYTRGRDSCSKRIPYHSMSTYCSEHECAEIDCHKEVLHTSIGCKNLCNYHYHINNCQKFDCHNKSIPGRVFCTNHKCSISDCDSIRVEKTFICRYHASLTEGDDKISVS